jgi:hypothetical protein
MLHPLAAHLAPRFTAIEFSIQSSRVDGRRAYLAVRREGGLRLESDYENLAPFLHCIRGYPCQSRAKTQRYEIATSILSFQASTESVLRSTCGPQQAIKIVPSTYLSYDPLLPLYAPAKTRSPVRLLLPFNPHVLLIVFSYTSVNAPSTMTDLQTTFNSTNYDKPTDCESSDNPVTGFIIEVFFFVLIEELLPHLVSRYWIKKQERVSRFLFAFGFIYLIRKHSSKVVVSGLGFLWDKGKDRGQRLLSGWLGGCR